MKKKVLALLLVVCMVAGMIPTFATAAGTTATTSKTGRTYYTEERMAAMQNNIEQYKWAKDIKTASVRSANSYLNKVDDLAEYAYENLLPSQEIPRGILVGLRWDPKGYHCKYCDADLRTLRSRDKMYDIDTFNHPWKIQCPSCRNYFPSNDFKSFYESGLDEHGNFSYELALENGQQFLKNTTFADKDATWGVDDSRGYRTGNTYSPLSASEATLYKNRYGFDFSTMEESWTFIAYYAHYGLWRGDVNRILTHLRDAYLYTGDAKYGRVGAIMIDRIADLYPEMFTKPWYEYSNSDGNTPTGKMAGSIWQTGSSTLYAQCYDAFYPMYEDQTVIDFISAKAAALNLDEDYYVPDYDSWDYDVDGYKNTSYTDPLVLKKGNAKNTAALIRQNIEENLIAENIRAVYQGNISGNFGMHQNTMATSAVVLDSNPMTQEALNWLTTPAEAGYGDEKRFVSALPGTANKTDDDVDGGNVINALTEQVYNDGATIEGAPNYARFWPEQIYSMIYALAGYDGYDGVNLLKNPKVLMMFKQMNPLLLLRNKTLSVGDSSNYYGEFMFPENNAVFMQTNDTEMGQLLYWMNGNTVEGLHGSIFDDSAKMQEQVQKIIDTHGEYDFDKSEQATGWGLSIVRNGTKNSLVDTQRFNYIYSGVSSHHGHQNKMELGLGAFGIDFAPDFGYPEAADGSYRVVYRDKATVTSNTVIVDDVIQPQVRSRGFPLHFDDSERVSVIDMRDTTAYNNVDEYRRSTMMIEVDEENAYTVDFFRVIGGNAHVYNFHAASSADATGNLNFVKQTTGTYAGANVAKEGYRGTGNTSGYDFLTDVRRAASPGSDFTVDFPINVFKGYNSATDDYHLKMTMLNDFDLTEVALAKCDTPRITGNPTDPIEFVLARREGTNLDSLFTTVFEPYDTTSFIASQESVPITRVGGSAEGAKDTAKAIKVTLKNGRVDYIVYATNGGVRYKVDNLFEFKGFVGVYMLKDASATEPMYLYLNDGTRLGSMAGEAAYTGTIVDFTTGDTLDNSITVTINEECNPYDLIGEYVYIANDGEENAVYEIESVEILSDGNIKLKTGLISYIRGMVDDQDVSKGYTYNIAKGQTLTIPRTTIMDDSPVVVAPSATSLKFGESKTITLDATDPLGGTLSVTALEKTPGLSIDGTEITFVPQPSQIGKNLIGFEVKNASGKAVVYWEVTVLPPNADLQYKFTDAIALGTVERINTLTESNSALKTILETTASDPWSYVAGDPSTIGGLLYERVFLFGTRLFEFGSDELLEGESVEADTNYARFKVSVAEDGKYYCGLDYRLYDDASAADIYLAPAVAGVDPVDDRYFVMRASNANRTDEATDAYVVSEKTVDLLAGDYYLTFVRKDDTGKSFRYFLVNTFDLVKSGAYEVPVADTVTISGDSIVTVGKTTTYTAKAEPIDASQEVVWSVSDERIATIDEKGVLTPIKAGLVTVTATAKEVETVSASKTVIVTEGVAYNYPFAEIAVALNKKYPGNVNNQYDIKNNATVKALFDENYAGSQLVSGGSPFYFHDTSAYCAYLQAAPEKGILIFSANYDAGTEVTERDAVLKIIIEKDGMYLPSMINQMAYNSAGADIYIAPVDDWKNMKDEKYLVLEVTNADRPASGSDMVKETIAEKPFFLPKGEYYVSIEKTNDAADGKFRYVYLKNFMLYDMGDPTPSVKISGVTTQFPKVGSTFTLTAEMTPNLAPYADIAWSSTDESVLTVENGTVNVVGEGFASIVASVDSRYNVSASCAFFVGSEVAYDYQFARVAAILKAIYPGEWNLKESSSVAPLLTNNYAAADMLSTSAPFCFEDMGTNCAYSDADPASGIYIFSHADIAGGEKTTDRNVVMKIKVAQSGKYFAQLINAMGANTAGVNVYLAPLSDRANMTNEKYRVLEVSNADRPTDGSVVEQSTYGTETFNLRAGEYYLVVEKTNQAAAGEYHSIQMKNFRLYSVGEYDGVEELSIVQPKDSLLSVGETCALELTTVPEKTSEKLNWSSSDTSVAIVDQNGVVTAKGTGHVEITVTVDRDPSLTASVSLLVANDVSYDYKFAEVGAALLGDASQVYLAPMGNNKCVVTEYEHSQPEGLVGAAPWKHSSYNGAQMICYSGNNAKLGVFMFGRKGGDNTCYVGLKIKVDQAGIYGGALLYNLAETTTTADIYLAPVDEVAAGASKVDEKYHFIHVSDTWTSGNPETGAAAVSGTPVTLSAGEYYVTFVQGGNGDESQRYLHVENLHLYRLGAAVSSTNGAAIRLTGEQGLRFYSQIDRDFIADQKVVEYGMLLLPNIALGGNDYNLVIGYKDSTTGYAVAQVPALRLYDNTQPDHIVYTAVLTKNPVAQYKRQITARAYAILEDGTTVYGNTVTRSIYEVAERGLQNPNATEQEIAAFNEIIAAADALS